MKKAKEFMNEFMETWNDMRKYQDVKLNPLEPNYDDFEKAFAEEKKIVKTIEYSDKEEIKNLPKKDEDWER